LQVAGVEALHVPNTVALGVGEALGVVEATAGVGLLVELGATEAAEAFDVLGVEDETISEELALEVAETVELDMLAF
jgi:hypothetical protein